MKKSLLSLIVCFCLFLTPKLNFAQSFVGQDFWFGFLANVPEDPKAAPPEYISYDVEIISNTDGSATVSVQKK